VKLVSLQLLGTIIVHLLKMITFALSFNNLNSLLLTQPYNT